MSTQIQLSYSSGKTVMSCQQKYFYAKVAKAPKDADYEEGDALGFGKAFHWVLEQTLHTAYNDKLIMTAMMDNKVPALMRPLLTAMLDNYVKVHKASGLKVVKCELQITSPVFNGFIDFIAQGENGWWLGDNKTASSHSESILTRLHKDQQVNLYAYFAKEIGEALKMKGPFLGFRYRQSIKSKAGTPAGLARGTPTLDIEIPASLLDPQQAWSDHLERHQIAMELHGGVAPKRNYNACMDYFRPCEYFSQCHGACASEGNPRITVHTIESLTSSDLLG